MMAVEGTEGRKRQERVPIDVAHLRRFFQPVVFAILKYAKTVDPEVPDAQLSSYHDCITIQFRKRLH